MIELKNVCKWYQTKWGQNLVLDDVNCRIEKGQSLAIVGLNGAGKSTLLRIIGGAELPSSGKIRRVGTVSWPIGFAGGFNYALSGEENCRFVARIYAQDVDYIVDYSREFAELGEYFYMPVRTYSSGMRARLAFGISMAIDFDSYLVDEVIAVGDQSFRDKCAAAFKERSARASMVMVSHYIQTLRAYCNRGAVLNNGRLEVFDTVDEASLAYQKLLKQKKEAAA